LQISSPAQHFNKDATKHQKDEREHPTNYRYAELLDLIQELKNQQLSMSNERFQANIAAL